jgi:hypothetical protein
MLPEAGWLEHKSAIVVMGDGAMWKTIKKRAVGSRHRTINPREGRRPSWQGRLGKVRYAAAPRLSPYFVATQWRHDRILRFNQTLELS